jgi:D-aminopeptidase
MVLDSTAWFVLIGLTATLLSVSGFAAGMPDKSDARPREAGLRIGVMAPGTHNAITDVAGVQVGQVTLIAGEDIRTGVTAILPHGGDLFQQKVPAGIFIANGFGKLAGSTQVQELGNLETPIVLTNTLSVAAGIDGLIAHTLDQPGNEDVR